jgi:hypothetical protein
MSLLTRRLIGALTGLCALAAPLVLEAGHRWI